MADTSTESSNSPPSPPELEFVFTSYVDADLTALRLIKVGTGDRVNVAITGGHWKLPDGTEFAKIVPVLGGEFGIIDSKKVFHPDIIYTVQFNDGKFGYVTAFGHGVAGVANIIAVKLETDSEKYSYLAGKVLLAPGAFVGSTLVASVFLPKEHWKK